ncbi:enhancer of mRNA decapping [Friedmanniomyces endolithicus]|uniref:Enhancer of mRNA-decapping protein 3 n=1 Tax=Friedmanniomyces endolithicus TaxID=329885 RepID=A0AAN6FIL6_9PEZI|nr:enhancer of mRNA decapping [Friedmanniomyces endolithicus]KAK0269070.1 enhancer of mRNA decapping [Friedmanniomyces endolithicus]KAK0318228.1 enhancer of mRNA decapping [Friedmanniomyces endolithicus]KAK1010952.1 enhancer of mRNA decapping [Friedmanniomyces endolithicus]KAK1043446.1 enhancer of mRNA decapping [Friedmanniomyces endolithicus]
MAGFLGMTVQVTLRQGSILHGKVRSVVAGQSLTLDDAFVPATGASLGLWTVQGTAIADLQVIDSNPTPTSAVRTTAPNFPPSSRSSRASRPPPVVPPWQNKPPPPVLQRPATVFIDPAILNYGKSPIPARTTQVAPVEVPATPVKSFAAKAVESLPVVNGSPFVAELGSLGVNGGQRASHIQQESAGPQPSPQRGPDVQSMDALGVRDGAQEGGEEGAAQAETGAKGMKKSRRRQNKKGSGLPSSDPPAVLSVEVSRNGNDMDINGTVKRGKGWRQTPLLQPSPQTTSPAVTKPTRRQRDQAQEMQQNGWATEDATDLQDMADFDFEASNKLFDKKGVFDELRQGDTTADEDRLVSHNKLPPRPGTHGGKNLHPTENVLSPKLAAMKYGSHEASSSSDADTEQRLAMTNGRSSSRHSVSRSVMGKKAPSRQNSNQADVNKPHPLAASMTSDRGGMARSITSLTSGRSKPVASIATTSPRPDHRTRSPQSTNSLTNKRTPSTTVQRDPHFIIQSTLAPCPVLHPDALHTLEAETIARYGLTQEAITETAARAIAETALNLFFPSPNPSTSRRGSRATPLRASLTSSTPALPRRSSTPHPQQTPQQPPVIVILAGSHPLGARAVAAARHLVSRGYRVLLAEPPSSSSSSSRDDGPRDPGMQAQLAILKRMQRAGPAVKWGPWRKVSGWVKGLAGPPAGIVDALLGGVGYDTLLSGGSPAGGGGGEVGGGGGGGGGGAVQQAEIREMIEWANRSRAPVLSLGCPSGVCGIEGTATVVEGEPVAVRPERVLCFGVPVVGLLAAMVGGGERWGVGLVDVGVNIALRAEEAVGFGREWVVELGVGEGEGEERGEEVG